MAGDGLDVIDLGERRWPDGWLRTGRVLPSRGRRGLAAALVVAVVLVTLAASGRLPPRLDRPIWTMSGQQSFSIGASNVYLQATGGTGLVALAPDTGHVRWRVPGTDLNLWSEFGDMVVLLGASALGPRLVAFNTDPSGEPLMGSSITRPATVPGDGPETVIADIATGQVLTRHLGYPLGLVNGGDIVLLVNWRIGDCPEGTRACQYLVAVNVRTGADLWSLAVPGELSPSDGNRDQPVITRVLIAEPDGRAVVRDAASGAVLNSLPLAPPNAVRMSASLAGDVLFTTYEVGAEIHLSKVRLDNGERLWTTTMTARSSDPALVPPFFQVSADGDLLVLAHDGVSTLVDPQSGRVRFDVAADGLRDLGEGRLLTHAFDEDASARIIDATTGITLGTYPDAEVVGDGRGHLLAVRQGDAWATITVLDTAGRETRWDAVRGDGLNCRARLDLFGCTDRSGQLRVWRVPA